METVTITKAEYEEYQKLKKIDYDFVSQVKESLEDAKAGRIKEI